MYNLPYSASLSFGSGAVAVKMQIASYGCCLCQARCSGRTGVFRAVNLFCASKPLLIAIASINAFAGSLSAVPCA